MVYYIKNGYMYNSILFKNNSIILYEKKMEGIILAIFTRKITIPVEKTIMADKNYKPLWYAVLSSYSKPCEQENSFIREVDKERAHKILSYHFNLQPQRRQSVLDMFIQNEILIEEEDKYVFPAHFSQTFVTCDPITLNWFYEEYKNKNMLFKMYLLLKHRYAWNKKTFSNTLYNFSISGGERSLLAQMGYSSKNNNNRTFAAECLNVLIQENLVECTKPQSMYELGVPIGTYRKLLCVYDKQPLEEKVWIHVPSSVVEEKGLQKYIVELDTGENHEQ